MNVIAAVVLAAVAMLFVAYPLLRKPEEKVAAPSANGDGDRWLEDLTSKRDSLYRAIRELDFDHSIGNLSDADYQEMREGLKRQAIGVLREIDEARAGQVILVDAPEREVQVEEGVRKVKPKGKARARAAASACPSCGQPANPAEKFCRHCGAAKALACPSCGKPYTAGDVFCANCGGRLKGAQRG